MRYNQFVFYANADSVDDMFSFVPAVTVKSDGTTIDNLASIKDCKFFADDDSIVKFNTAVESYLQYFEYDKACTLLFNLKSDLEKIMKSDSYSVSDQEFVSDQISALEKCIADNVCSLPIGNDCSKLYAYAISGYKGFVIGDIGHSVSCDSLIRNLKDCYNAGKKEDQMQDCKKIVETFLNEHLRMSECDLFKNVQVKLALRNGATKVSIENILDNCFSETQKAGKKGITGKSTKDKEVIRQILLTYFRSIFSYAGQIKVTKKASALIG